MILLHATGKRFFSLVSELLADYRMHDTCAQMHIFKSEFKRETTERAGEAVLKWHLGLIPVYVEVAALACAGTVCWGTNKLAAMAGAATKWL